MQNRANILFLSYNGLLEPILTRRLGILWDYVSAGKELKPETIREQLKLAKQEVESILGQK